MLGYKFKFVFSALLLCKAQSLMEWGSWRQQPVAYDTNARRQTLLAHASGYSSHQDVHDCLARKDQDDALFPGQKIDTIKPVNRMWPPWPFHVLGKRSEEGDGEITAANTYPSAAALLVAFCRQRALVFIRQCQEIGSQLWFHLPPAAPPLILLAGIPRTVVLENQQTKVVPMFSIPFCRNLVLSGLGLAVMSWAHMELHRKRKLAPLSIPFEDRVSSVFLPPFLPEEVPEPELNALDIEEKETAKGQNATTISTTTTESSEENSVINLVGPKIRRFYSDLYENAPRPSIFRELKRKRTQRKREAAKIRRLSIFDELVALQALKRKSKRLSNQNENVNTPSGYALVTGASQGIGRAIAVELARWEIPLILVARDISRLISLAYDLEACYGVKCCVLSADLSELDAAERIHDTTQKAGLSVDILVNNAGIALEGLAVDAGIHELERMMMVNTMSFAKLSNLYGQDMKRRRRGRVLMVSSMSGLTSSSANCGLYGATKAFEKSLSFSMAKELEPYGVGVTCLLPGPVTDTKFRDRSGTGRALCWYVPFYAKSPETVARLGVLGVLDGDVQVIPGLQNRLFAKLLRPVIPQRFETMIVQAAWSPFRWGFGRRKEDESEGEAVDLGASRQDSERSPPQVHLDLKPRYSYQMPPLLLELPKKEDAQPPQPHKQQQPAERTTEEDNSSVDLGGNEGIKIEEDTRAETTPTLEEPTLNESSPGEHNEMEANPDAAPEGGANETQEESKLSEDSPPLADAEVVATEQDQDTAVTPNLGESPQPEISSDEMKQDEKQSTPGETSEGSCVGTTLNRNERKSSKDSNVYGTDNDDEDGNDVGISPKLGPVDLFQNRKYVLPKSNRPLPTTTYLAV